MDDTRLFRRIGAIARQSTTAVNQKVKTYRLDNNLFLYLMRIVEHQGISQVALADLTKVDKTTLSRGLTKLAGLNYIRRQTDPKNKRFRQLFATKKGQDLYDELLYGIEQDYIRSALIPLSPSERLTLLALLEKVQPQ